MVGSMWGFILRIFCRVLVRKSIHFRCFFVFLYFRFGLLGFPDYFWLVGFSCFLASWLSSWLLGFSLHPRAFVWVKPCHHVCMGRLCESAPPQPPLFLKAFEDFHACGKKIMSSPCTSARLSGSFCLPLGGLHPPRQDHVIAMFAVREDYADCYCTDSFNAVILQL